MHTTCESLTQCKRRLALERAADVRPGHRTFGRACL